MNILPSNNIRLLGAGILVSVLAACQSSIPDTAEVPETTHEHSEVALGSTAIVVKQIPDVQQSESEQQDELPITNLWDRIRGGLQLQEYYDHPDVAEQLQSYTDNQAFFDLTIERARPFLYGIVNELEARNLPQELALLPFVESAFNPNANSSEHAVGLWQFMGATAASFGLQQDWWYDARRDPQASTFAALDYLEELAQQFDQDWLLALAAYNAGDGNVRRAIRRSKNSDPDNPFWDLALPRETRSHVPKVLAIAKLVNDVDSFPVELAPISNTEPLTRVEIGAQIDLAQAAQLAAIEYDALRELNPGYLQWATHPEQPQHILLPHTQAELLRSQLASLPLNQLLTWDHYVIQPGDSLGKIALKLNTRVDVLQRVNNLRGSRIIAGDSLLIPRGANADGLAGNPMLATGALSSTPIPSNYRIRAGDNLWSIARRFDLRSADIALWNAMELDAILRPGQIISLSPDASSGGTEDRSSAASNTTYIVRKGDSMAGIASRFNTSLEDLLEHNQLEATTIIFPGQVIEISPPASTIN